MEIDGTESGRPASNHVCEEWTSTDLSGGLWRSTPATQLLSDAGARERELFRCRSLAAGLALERKASGPVLSHQSAAAILGLSLLLPDMRTVHTTNRAHHERSCGRQNNRHSRGPRDVTIVNGIRVTAPFVRESPAKSWSVDCPCLVVEFRLRATR